MTKISGYIIYEGASEINGVEIVAIVTLKSTNIKTGNMASMWIMHKDIAPTKASKSGEDEAVCGSCIFRHHTGGACYVTLHHAPLAVWKAYKRGNYIPTKDYSVFKDMRVRFGAYGDPYAIPVSILTSIKAQVSNNTSYTHQWKENGNNILKTMSMASVDNKLEAVQAQAEGWRTFRVVTDETDLLDSEIICPNFTKGTQCFDCKLCSGTASKAKSIVIPVHGNKSKKFSD